MVGGRERVTTAGTARRMKRDKAVKIARLSGCKNLGDFDACVPRSLTFGYPIVKTFEDYV